MNLNIYFQDTQLQRMYLTIRRGLGVEAREAFELELRGVDALAPALLLFGTALSAVEGVRSWRSNMFVDHAADIRVSLRILRSVPLGLHRSSC